MSVKELSDIIEKEVEEPFDHKNLNLDVPEFANLIPTAEHIAYVIWHKLRKVVSTELGLEVTLYETPRNFVKYNGL